MHWPAPIVAKEVEPDEGPVMVTVEYRIDPAKAKDFAMAMREMRRIRRRDGAISWGLFRDTREPSRFIEYFMTPSWVEHLRQHERITVSDRRLQERVWAFHLGEGPPLVSHYVAEPLPAGGRAFP
jgi:quinol monooxygenase YgiN